MFYRNKTLVIGYKAAQLCLTVCLSFFSLGVLATGNLDITYGNSGVSKFTIPSSGASLMDLVMLTDDRVIVGGSNLNTQTSLAFTRFNQQGNLDLSFGSGNGYVNYSPPTVPVALIEGFSVDSSYNIYAVGHGQNLSNEAYIFKLDVSGALDTSFANGGLYSSSSHPRLPVSVNTRFKAVAVQPDNKVVIVGRSDSLGAFVLRLLPSGGYDKSFGSFRDGLEFVGSFPIASLLPASEPESVKVLDSGEIVIGGFLNNAGWGSFVVRFTGDGVLDTGFNDDGIYLLSTNGWLIDWAGFIEVDRLGSVYLLSRVISSGSGTFNQCLVTKLNYKGYLYSSYGNNGQVMLAPPAGDIYNCGSIAAASHGGMAIAVMDRYPVPGATYNGPAKVLRLDSDGNLVSSFGNLGVASVWTPHITNSTYLAGLFNHTFVESQSDGKLVFAIGEYQNSLIGYTVGRLEDDSNSFITSPSTFSSAGMQPSNTMITSNSIQIQNSDPNAWMMIDIENGEYSINGQQYTSASGWARQSDSITVRNQTGQGPGFSATTKLSLGGDRDRKNAGMLHGKRITLEFLISTDPIISISIGPVLGPVTQNPL